MQRIDGCWIYSASDLNDFVECAHLTALEREAALGGSGRPQRDAAVELLARKGDEHERRHLERLQRRYRGLVAFADDGERSIQAYRAAQTKTLAAMEGGAPYIYQATFFDGAFLGRADFLRRVERPSARWPWSYEAIDTKLALNPKPYYLVQLCNYSEHLERLQGSAPVDMHVVLGSGEERHFRVDDFAAYYRNVKARFLQTVGGPPQATYPFENPHCSVCSWNDLCARRRSSDDHLSLVANIRRDQIAKLEAAGIATLAALGAEAEPPRPYGLLDGTFAKLRAQARLQHLGRTSGQHVYELLPHGTGDGFERLPAPDDADVYFDIEGDPLYAPERGLEYLFGVYLPKECVYRAFWARSDREERAAFETLMDFLVDRRRRHPDMHVYHYAPYETTALRRLMGYHASRERELDDLLRNHTFVDLYAIVRQSLRISQPSYSIKKLEAFYGMTRSTDVRRGDDSIVMFESWLTGGDESILVDIERYNEDDCRSTYCLHQWLLGLRSEWARAYGRVPAWHQTQSEDPPPEDGRSELQKALHENLLAPRSLAHLRQWPEEARGRWLLGHLLDYHAREAKPAYWKLYDRYENTDRLLEFDHEAIGGLTLCDDVPAERVKQSFVYTYRFPEQQHNLGTDTPVSPHHRAGAGTVIGIDDEHRRLRIKLSRNIVPNELRALVPGKPMDTRSQRNAIARVAAAFLDGSIERRYPATLSLILARAPRCLQPRPVVQPARVDGAAVSDVVASLDASHLVVQGPPGSGKSTIAAAVIVDLLAAGKRIGILANGHKAIHNLLHKVEESAHARGVRFSGLQKFTTGNEGSQYASSLVIPLVRPVPDAAAFAREPHDLAAGTSWLFSRDELAGAYDYLFVDEAGQMSLADAVACSTAARNVVLLGDPLQLAQVSQGSHPLGTDASVLGHLLAGDETIDPSRGIFLDVSYRMHPAICGFISHAVYDDRLRAAPACKNNRIDAPMLSGSGLRYLPIAHEANYRASPEEAAAVATCVADLLRGTVSVGEQPRRPMTQHDVLVVSPYNAQRALIRRRLAEQGLADVRVGTVDKFQGQEAPVVLYSLATSSGATLPRDLEFLFEKNRLNVAISRAQCLTVLICSPQLLELRCKTPDEMALVNLLCAYVESAQAQEPARVQ
ncbi:MAG TPA: TM0106 family RecB-like putative nuclease [Candidatus Baltobacteraceae bacterium]|nr:TM0106 family RecB-like putative nuclease [Candidatus Baltobacteraceae bacterium]